MDDKSVATNKSPATTCCGNGSNEIGPTNQYKYGPNNNESGATCCCGSVSIETGTKVVAIVSCVLYMIVAIVNLLNHQTVHLLHGVFGIALSLAYLLVVYGQNVRNPWLFLPCLILEAIEMIFSGFIIIRNLVCSRETLAELKKSAGKYSEYVNDCTLTVIVGVGFFVLNVWLYSIIFRGFMAVKEVKSRRSRPAVV
uniref:MARVEL domain-containing protein n=1 Tax=Globodera rostochiensis TaxID=31243 RepID=A0A914I148_GLORO